MRSLPTLSGCGTELTGPPIRETCSRQTGTPFFLGEQSPWRGPFLTHTISTPQCPPTNPGWSTAATLLQRGSTLRGSLTRRAQPAATKPCTERHANTWCPPVNRRNRVGETTHAPRCEGLGWAEKPGASLLRRATAAATGKPSLPSPIRTAPQPPAARRRKSSWLTSSLPRCPSLTPPDLHRSWHRNVTRP